MMTTPATAPIGTVRSTDDTLRSVLLSQARPPRPSALAAVFAFAWRGLLKIKYVPEQLLDVIAIPIIFTLMFTYLFGGALAGSTGAYLQFLLPGTLVMTVVLVTMYAGTGLNTDVTTGVFDRFRTVPIWRPAPIIGALLGDLARYLLAATLVIVLGLVLGFRPGGGLAGVLLALALVLAFAFGVSWVWMVLGLVMRTPTAVMTVSTVVLFPLSMASNVFVQPKTTPGWLQTFINVNPITHLVTAARGLMLHGTVPASDVRWVLLASALLAVVFAPLTLYLYRNKR